MQEPDVSSFEAFQRCRGKRKATLLDYYQALVPILRSRYRGYRWPVELWRAELVLEVLERQGREDG